MKKEKYQVLDGRSFVMCRLVHYLNGARQQFPFLLTSCEMPNDGKATASGVIFDATGCKYLLNVPYDRNKNVDTWHFPTMYRPKKKTGPQPGKPLLDLTASKK